MKLELGYNHPFEIRNYTYAFDPLAGRRILYLSDMHYHLFSKKRVASHVEHIHRLNPDLLLLGGDYVDTPLGLPHFQHLAESVSHIPTFVIAGNHDRPYLRRIRQIAETAGVTWLHHSSTTLRLGPHQIRIDGATPIPNVPTLHPEKPPGPHSDFSILILHHPINVRPFASQYNLIFAGHLHGGQIVLWQNEKGLYPVRWRYRWNQLAIDYGSCQYLISKGAGETFPIRYNCQRDFILVTCTPKQDNP
jgi:predicted MPP superfamily phosphohydrolase